MSHRHLDDVVKSRAINGLADELDRLYIEYIASPDTNVALIELMQTYQEQYIKLTGKRYTGRQSSVDVNICSTQGITISPDMAMLPETYE